MDEPEFQQRFDETWEEVSILIIVFCNSIKYTTFEQRTFLRIF